MKGNFSTHTYTQKGRDNHDLIFGDKLQIKKPMTDKELALIVEKQLVRVDKEHPNGYQDANCGYGYLAEENFELLGAIHRGKGIVSSEVLGEIIDNIVVLTRMARLYGK